MAQSVATASAAKKKLTTFKEASAQVPTPYFKHDTLHTLQMRARAEVRPLHVGGARLALLPWCDN